jgi:hypothetical protein
MTKKRYVIALGERLGPTQTEYTMAANLKKAHAIQAFPKVWLVETDTIDTVRAQLARMKAQFMIAEVGAMLVHQGFPPAAARAFPEDRPDSPRHP